MNTVITADTSITADAVSLDVTILMALGARVGVQTWPVVLDLYPDTDDAVTAESIAADVDAAIAAHGLWDRDEPVGPMAVALRVLSAPDRMIEVRIFGADGVRRVCIARRDNDHVVADRRGRSVRISVPDITAIGEIGAVISRLFDDAAPMRIDGFSTPASELADRLDRCGTGEDIADALHACGAHAADATALAAALTAIRSRAEIVAVTRSDATVTQSSGALAIFDTDRGRVVVSPSESPDGHVWSTMSPGTGHRIVQAVGLLIETLPGGWWSR